LAIFNGMLLLGPGGQGSLAPSPGALCSLGSIPTDQVLWVGSLAFRSGRDQCRLRFLPLRQFSQEASGSFLRQALVTAFIAFQSNHN
jgi:hypothetical protein